MKLLHGSINKKLRLLVLLATLPVLFVLILSEYEYSKESLEHINVDYMHTLNSFSELQNRVTDSTASLLRTVAELPAVQAMNEEGSRTLLEKVLFANSIYSNIILVDLNGDVVSAGKGHEAAKKLNFANRKQFIDAINNQCFVPGEFVIGKQSSKAIFPFGIPVVDINDDVIGVILIGIDLNHLQKMFDVDSYYKNFYLELCDLNGRRIFRYPMSEETIIGEPINSDLYDAAITNTPGSILTSTSDNREDMVIYKPLQVDNSCDPYMYMFLGYDYQDIRGRELTKFIRLIILMVLSLFFALVVADFAGNRIVSGQIARLSDTASEFSKGDMDISTGLDYSDGELGSLAESFDSMVAAIKEREEEKILLQKQIDTSQKMDAIGKLAGGIAHDFNNILSSILGSAELLGKHIDEEKRRKYQQLIITSVNRASDLAGKLLTFSKSEGDTESVVEINSILKETVQMMKSTIEKRIELKTDIKLEESYVIGDSSMLQSAFFNISINAFHAIEGRGIIAIATEHAYLDDEFCRKSYFDIEPGEYVVVTIKDNGCGISTEDQEKIFDPFFTTKEDGTGLGLPTVYGTIKQCRGAIDLESEPGEGTTFKFYLPLTQKPVTLEKMDEKQEKGVKTILIVDDEEVIRDTTGMLLEDLGYKTLFAENGSVALEIIKDKGREIDLVILDMMMPVMNGKEAFFAIKRINSDIKILLCTALVSGDDLHFLLDNGLNGYIKKPYNVEKLSRAISGILEA